MPQPVPAATSSCGCGDVADMLLQAADICSNTASAQLEEGSCEVSDTANSATNSPAWCLYLAGGRLGLGQTDCTLDWEGGSCPASCVAWGKQVGPGVASAQRWYIVIKVILMLSSWCMLRPGQQGFDLSAVTVRTGCCRWAPLAPRLLCRRWHAAWGWWAWAVMRWSQSVPSSQPAAGEPARRSA